MQNLFPKLFDEWNKQKKKLQQNKATDKLYFCEGDIWWCSLGQNIGTESYGKGTKFSRPVLVFKKLSAYTCIALPLTSQKKIGTWFTHVTYESEIRYVMLYQIRMIHTKEIPEKDYKT